MLLTSNIMKFHDELGVCETIDAFAAAGFDGIEFNADLKEYYTNAHNKEFYLELRRYAEEKGILIPQAHAPFSSSYTDEEKTKQRFFDIVKSMRHVSWLGVKNIIVHPCRHIDCTTDDGYARMMEYNLDFYKRLIPYAEEYGLRIAIENIRDCITVTAKGLLELLHALDNDVFTVCYDVGHANKTGQSAVDMIYKLGDVIECTHIHDNDGVNDTHTLPYYGTIDWEGVMCALAEVGYKGNLNYEAGNFVKNMPIALRSKAAEYMVSVGKYLIERYHHYKNLKR